MVSMTYYIKIKKAVLLMKQIGHIKNNFLSESLRTIEYILCLNEMIWGESYKDSLITFLYVEYISITPGHYWS